MKKGELGMETVSAYFGSLVFDDRVMKANLSAEVYQSLKKTIDEGAQLDLGVANAVAAAMKDWADRKSTRLNSSHRSQSRMPSSA